MRFGLFGSAQESGDNLGAGVGQGFHDYVDFNVEAESLGYYSSFLVEHHFTGWGQVSATLNLLTWLASRTTMLRVGTATMMVGWYVSTQLAKREREKFFANKSVAPESIVALSEIICADAQLIERNSKTRSSLVSDQRSSWCCAMA